MLEYIAIILVILFLIVCKAKKQHNRFILSFYYESPKLDSFQVDKKKCSDWSYVFVFVALFILFAFRNISVGTDTNVYNSMFNSFEVDNPNWRGEPVYWLIVFFVKLLGLPFNFVLIFVGAISFANIYFFTKKYSIDKFLTILLLFCLGIIPTGFNVMRQFLALSFFLLALDNLFQNKVFRYVGFCLISTFCHNTAIILLPLFLIKFIKLNYKTLIITIILTMAAIFTLPLVVKFVSKFTSKDYYEIYITTNAFAKELGFAYLLYDLFMIGAFVWFWIIRKNIDNDLDKKNYNMFLWIFLLAVCIRTIATYSGFIIMTNRLLIYFLWAICFLIPFSIKYLPKNPILSKDLYSKTVIFLAILYFYLGTVVRGQAEIIPFKFVAIDNLLIQIVLYLFFIGSLVVACFYELDCEKKLNKKNFKTYENKRK